MALPPFQRTSFEPSEQVFIALQTTQIDFIPNCSISKFRTLNGSFIGPLIPLRQLSLPLWCAIQCKQKKKGRVICPDWLSLDQLSNFLRLETSLPQFSALPFHWLEISKLLIDVAPDDIPSIDQVRTVLKDLREVRQSKTRNGLSGLDSLHLETPNLSALELNELRPVFSLAHIRLLQLDPKQETYDQFLSQLESTDRSNQTYENTFSRQTTEEQSTQSGF